MNGQKNRNMELVDYAKKNNGYKYSISERSLGADLNSIACELCVDVVSFMKDSDFSIALMR